MGVKMEQHRRDIRGDTMEWRGLFINNPDRQIQISIYPAGNAKDGAEGYVAMAKEQTRRITVQEFSKCRLKAVRMALSLLEDEILLKMEYDEDNTPQ
jgi:hypothetical protein